ncbi:hypothetical protein PUN28_013751 [Cardiocondyla obscurior]|uniref:Uncharacterized protein n=1 Tax=Cardiocondyla obscurior TaxID=286306 RepID=A0AAW2F8Q1_9HYME
MRLHNMLQQKIIYYCKIIISFIWQLFLQISAAKPLPHWLSLSRSFSLSLLLSFSFSLSLFNPHLVPALPRRCLPAYLLYPIHHPSDCIQITHKELNLRALLATALVPRLSDSRI